MSSNTQEENLLPPPPLSPRLPYNQANCIESSDDELKFIAVRRGGSEGSSLRNCIFSNWDDVKMFLQHLQVDVDAECKVFDDIFKAVKFAFGITNTNTNANTSIGMEINDNRIDENDHSGGSGGSRDSSRDGNASLVDTLMEEILPNSDPPFLPEIRDTDGTHDMATTGRSMPNSTSASIHVAPNDSSKNTGIAEENITNTANNIIESSTTPSSFNITPYNSQISPVIDSIPSPIPITAQHSIPLKNRTQIKPIQKNDDCTSTCTCICANNGTITSNPTTLLPSSKRRTTHTNGKKTSYNWDRQYLKLREYMEQYGNNTPIPKTSNNLDLIRWTNQQKRDYRELQSKGQSKLEPSQLQRLNDIGFQFTSRRRYKTWEECMNEFREFKDRFGHSRVPVAHPTLGSWVHAQRRQYKLYVMKDSKTKLTEEKIHLLKEAGFLFEVARKSQLTDDARSNAKSWDDRYEELKSFKTRYGHTIVPQHYPKLGWWVNTQRKEHKKLIAGMKSTLSGKRVLKLVEIDFVFDASGKRGNNGSHEDGGATSALLPTTAPLIVPIPNNTTFIGIDNVNIGGDDLNSFT